LKKEGYHFLQGNRKKGKIDELRAQREKSPPLAHHATNVLTCNGGIQSKEPWAKIKPLSLVSKAANPRVKKARQYSMGVFVNSAWRWEFLRDYWRVQIIGQQSHAWKKPFMCRDAVRAKRKGRKEPTTIQLRTGLHLGGEKMSAPTGGCASGKDGREAEKILLGRLNLTVDKNSEKESPLENKNIKNLGKLGGPWVDLYTRDGRVKTRA